MTPDDHPTPEPTPEATPQADTFPDDIVLADTQRWVERAIIGLTLCPFAEKVQRQGQVHYAVSHAIDAEGLIADLQRELEALAQCTPARRETTLLIAPLCMADFLAFNDFLDLADALIEAMDLGGILQVAAFHPRFQFVDSEVDDMGNAANRAPYPTLHLLREDSIEEALTEFGDQTPIDVTNNATLQALGAQGWAALDVGARCPLHSPPSEKPPQP